MMAIRVMVLLLILVSVSLAQAPEIVWTRILGGYDNEYLGWLEPAHDVGWIAAGQTRSYGAGNDDFYFIKILPDGETAWTRVYGGEGTDIINDIRQTRDGGYIACGWSNSYDPGAFYHIMKLDANGEFLWQHQYGGDTSANYGYGICQMADGGFLVVGDVYCHTIYGYDWDLYVVKTDESGNILNQYQIVKQGSQGGYRVIPTSDGGAMMVTGRSMWLVKFQPNGDTAWTRSYSSVSVANSIIELDEGGYAAFGYRDRGYDIEDQFWLLRLNASAETLWTRYYGGSDPDEGYSHQRTWDGGYVMIGHMYPVGEPFDISVVKADANGNQLWSTHFGGPYSDFGVAVQCTEDRGYIVGGRIYGDSNATYNIYIVRLGPDTLVSGIENNDGNVTPRGFQLGANYPNPFNAATIIEYELQSACNVTIDIFDIRGREVGTMYEGRRNIGKHKAAWRADGLSSGVYFYQLNAGGFTETRKMVVLK